MKEIVHGRGWGVTFWRSIFRPQDNSGGKLFGLKGLGWGAATQRERGGLGQRWDMMKARFRKMLHLIARTHGWWEERNMESRKSEAGLWTCNFSVFIWKSGLPKIQLSFSPSFQIDSMHFLKTSFLFEKFILVFFLGFNWVCLWHKPIFLVCPIDSYHQKLSREGAYF